MGYVEEQMKSIGFITPLEMIEKFSLEKNAYNENDFKRREIALAHIYYELSNIDKSIKELIAKIN